MAHNNRILIADDNQSIHDDYRAILCPKGSDNLDELNTIEVVAERLIRELSRSICIDDNEFALGVSVGISEFSHDGETADILIKNAAIAM